MYHEANFFEINNCLERGNFIQSSVTLYRVRLTSCCVVAPRVLVTSLKCGYSGHKN